MVNVMKHKIERIQGHTDALPILANKFFAKMEAQYPDFEVITTQVVQLNTCVTMYITYII